LLHTHLHSMVYSYHNKECAKPGNKATPFLISVGTGRKCI
jgi:hypothetical protein